MFVSRAVLALVGALVIASGAHAQTAAPPGTAFGHYEPAVQFDGGLTTSFYLPMRDGVRLAVSVTRPASGGKAVEGRFPVIWQHTLGIAGAGTAGGPLGNDPRRRGYGGVSSLVRHGYVVVQVARRGNGPSFGRRRGYNDRSEAYDSYEVIDWLAKQTWSTGKVGVYGCSNTGDAAMHAYTAGNPNLKAVFAGYFSWEKYDGFLRGGIFANWGTGPERTIAQDMNNTPVQGDESKALLRQAAEEHQGAPPLAAMWQAMPYRDSLGEGPQSRFWYEGSVAAYLPQIKRSDAAVYVQGGWADDLRGQGLVAFANLPGRKHIVIGPWGHCGNDDFDLLSEIHRFFDQELKDVDTGINNDPPIHYFAQNAAPGTEWRTATSWAALGSKATSVFLTSGRDGAAGSLALRAPRTGATTFTVNYAVDCPSRPPRPDGLLTGAPPCPVAAAGPHYATGVLKADTEVTGDPIADLWVSTSTPDANIFVYLEDVSPDGKVTPVTDARLKASLGKLGAPPYENYGLPWHRSHREDAQPMTAGVPVRMTFAFLPTSYVFKAGHRLQISVAGADYRERDRSPKTPAPEVTLHTGADMASSISLPIIGQSGF